jgi:hypothetical protein
LRSAFAVKYLFKQSATGFGEKKIFVLLKRRVDFYKIK